MRHCLSDENAKVQIKRVKSALSPDGEVRIIQITDKQFGKIEVFFGNKRKYTEQPALQLQFF
jgi:CRISPR-associated protein Cas2